MTMATEIGAYYAFVMAFLAVLFSRLQRWSLPELFFAMTAAGVGR